MYLGDRDIARVLYRLTVEREVSRVRTLKTVEDIPGLQDIRGQLTVIDGERDLFAEEPLTLHLEDGRRWQFFATFGEPVSGQYKVVNAGGDLLVE